MTLNYSNFRIYIIRLSYALAQVITTSFMDYTKIISTFLFD